MPIPKLSPVVAATAIALALALPLTAPAALAESLTVTGEGATEIAPDMATLQVGVTTTADTAADALAINSSALDAVLARLRAAGVEDRDLSLRPVHGELTAEHRFHQC